MRYQSLILLLAFLNISLLTQASILSSSKDSTTETTPTPDKINFTLSGVLRFTYNYSEWKEGQKQRGGDFGYDVFSLRANATYNNFFLNADYRLYSEAFGGTYLKHGWMGYNINENSNVQLGLTQVPFGVMPYNSNSWFYSLACYAGFEDDYDMGIKYSRTSNNWDFSFAYFKNAEEYSYADNGDVSYSRYAYDLASMDIDGDGNLDYRNKEINQFNGQAFYKINTTNSLHRLGASVQASGIYNIDTEEIGSHYAYALHYELTYKRFNIKAQGISYEYNTEAPDGERTDIIAVGAYGAPNTLAAKAQIYTLAVSYTLPLEDKVISSIKFYNDYGYIKKHSDEDYTLHDSQMNVTGLGISAGPIYANIDWAMGVNHSWLGGDWNTAFGDGSADAKWEKRFNINIGYYF